MINITSAVTGNSVRKYHQYVVLVYVHGYFVYLVPLPFHCARFIWARFQLEFIIEVSSGTATSAAL
jgi:hypothetical protein